MADVMLNVVDRIGTVVTLLYLWVAGGTATVADVRPPFDEPCRQILCLGGR